MSMGLLVGERQALVPDNFMTGLIVTRTLKDMLWGELDYLIVDLPPGTGEPQQTLLKTMSVDGAVIVTTPQPMAVMDAERSADLFRKAGVPILGAIENMSYVLCPDCGKEIEIFPRGDKSGGLFNGEIPTLARVPMDPSLSERITAEHPLVTGHPGGATSFFRDVAAAIVGKLPPGGE